MAMTRGSTCPRWTTFTNGRAWAASREGLDWKYPVISEGEFCGETEPLAHDKGLCLVGNANSRRVTRVLEADWRIKIEADAVAIAKQKITGKQLGAAFIRP